MSKPVKVRFPLEDHALGIDAEWMWASQLPGGLLELDNSPFHAYGLSYRDTIRVAVVDDVLQFQAVERKSGHRTVRVRFDHDKSHADFVAVWPPLEALGCTFEGSQVDRPLYSIDVPPGTNLDDVTHCLAELEDRGILEFEEADCF